MPHHYYAGLIQQKILKVLSSTAWLVTDSVGSAYNDLASGSLPFNIGDQLLLCVVGRRQKTPLINGGITGPHAGVSWTFHSGSAIGTSEGDDRAIEWWYSSVLTQAPTSNVAIDVDSSGYALVAYCLEVQLGPYALITPNSGQPAYGSGSNIDFGGGFTVGTDRLVTGMAAWTTSTDPNSGGSDFNAGFSGINDQFNALLRGLVGWRTASGITISPNIQMPVSVNWITSLVQWQGSII